MNGDVFKGFINLILLTFVINVPLGIWRSRVKKFSFSWFVAIHLAVPLIYFFRTSLGLPIWTVSILIVAAVIGQLAGGRSLSP